MNEAANPEGADARSPEALTDAEFNMSVEDWAEAFAEDPSCIYTYLSAAVSRGAKARDEEWWAAVGKLTAWCDLDCLGPNNPCEEAAPLRALMGDAPKAPTDPASGSPSVPAAQPKDQANQGAAAQAVELRGWFCPDCPMVVRTAVGAACPNCGAELLTPTTWRKMLNDLLAAERTSRRTEVFGRDASLKADLADREVPATTADVWKHHAAQMVQILRAASGSPRAAPTPALPREAPEPGGTLAERPAWAQLVDGALALLEPAERRARQVSQTVVGPSVVQIGASTLLVAVDSLRDALSRAQPRAAPTDSAPATPGRGPPSAGNGVAIIAAERKRQVEKEGWTPEHDDEHSREELARAAACYATPRSYAYGPTRMRLTIWPWVSEWWKPSPDRIRELAKAGALIAAEIDRLQRASERAPSSPESPAVAADAGDRNHE